MARVSRSDRRGDPAQGEVAGEGAALVQLGLRNRVGYEVDNRMMPGVEKRAREHPFAQVSRGHGHAIDRDGGVDNPAIGARAGDDIADDLGEVAVDAFEPKYANLKRRLRCCRIDTVIGFDGARVRR
jgi:hypothetical protein